MKKWKIDWAKLEGKIETKENIENNKQNSNLLEDKESDKHVLNIWMVKRTLKRG